MKSDLNLLLRNYPDSAMSLHLWNSTQALILTHTRMIRHMDCQIASYLVIIGPEGIEAMNFELRSFIVF